MSRSRFLLLVAVLAAGIALSWATGHFGNPFRVVGYRPLVRPLTEFPRTIQGDGDLRWVGEDRELPARAVEVAGMDRYLNRLYESKDGRVVQLFLSYYGNVSAGIDSIYHNPTICFPAQGWNEVARKAMEIPISGKDGTRLPVTMYRFRKGLSERVVLNFFLLNGRVLEKSPRDDPMELARGKLKLGSGPGYYVQIQVVADGGPGGEEGVAAARGFLAAAGGTIVNWF